MPKRTAQEKLERYQRKIRRLEEEATKKQRRRARRPLDSSSDDEDNPHSGNNNTDVNNDPLDQQGVVDNNETGESDPAHVQIQFDPPVDPIIPNVSTSVESIVVATETQNNVTANTQQTSEQTTEVNLDPELLTALGASTSDTPEFGENIHETLASLWTPILKRGLPKEEKDKLLREHLIPGNCTLLQAPKLNAEISAAVSELSRGRDKKLVGFQQQLGTGVAALNKGLDTLLRSENKALALKHLSDSCRILSDLHSCFTKDRTKLITPSLDKNFIHMLQDSERDETLFGNSLSEKIKASKAIERQGQQIKKTMQNQKTASPASTPGTRYSHQGNWSGPPRYPSNRGGRGGSRRPYPAPVRRPYTPSATPPPPRSSQQTKSRAPAPHQ